ncbi:hypothetical protein CJ307_35135, partial [Klebsiella quasipneumoniae]
PLRLGVLAKSQQTLAIYMGTMKAAEISAQLIAHGRAGHYKPDSAPLRLGVLAKSQQTLAIYMGTMKAAEISAQLIA